MGANGGVESIGEPTPSRLIVANGSGANMCDIAARGQFGLVPRSCCVREGGQREGET